jgi:hypothetical protein
VLFVADGFSRIESLLGRPRFSLCKKRSTSGSVQIKVLRFPSPVQATPFAAAHFCTADWEHLYLVTISPQVIYAPLRPAGTRPAGENCYIAILTISTKIRIASPTAIKIKLIFALSIDKPPQMRYF